MAGPGGCRPPGRCPAAQANCARSDGRRSKLKKRCGKWCAANCVVPGLAWRENGAIALRTETPGGPGRWQMKMRQRWPALKSKMAEAVEAISGISERLAAVAKHGRRGYVGVGGSGVACSGVAPICAPCAAKAASNGMADLRSETRRAQAWRYAKRTDAPAAGKRSGTIMTGLIVAERLWLELVRVIMWRRNAAGDQKP